ncbi:MAG: hypothetical protein UV68_C0061G0003 [Candidatus Collierbacteria bacterium GW2011_GWC2_43_12]|uniref:Uncharacterized protein n=1 Tax=Candidatus Collierbacteria bacterium GW2011_GWC2_43_12 TaxID=1618390 RepID=A0A0G1FYC3_9BACT|nr:MAG: hypothetical protein UV68_C0061G0003 [Candidatus Collierbacteria bacterium GW2011_GWC2_43_12]KKU73262.1 MAG: hypothetical protein UX96_C0007G0059 [Candidatus Wolfebacteria bacterium GW2011_GWB1_47_243]
MFSESLITRAQQYFAKRFGQEVSRAEAESYLHSLADLYLCLAEAIEERTTGDAPPVGRASPVILD